MPSRLFHEQNISRFIRSQATHPTVSLAFPRLVNACLIVTLLINEMEASWIEWTMRPYRNYYFHRYVQTSLPLVFHLP